VRGERDAFAGVDAGCYEERWVRVMAAIVRAILACVLVGLVSALSSCAPKGGPGAAAALPSTDHPLRGSPAPRFSLAARGGASASLDDHSGKVVLVDFWATWCEPCRSSFPRYQALLARYPDRVVVLGISEDDEDQGIDRFAQETGASFPLAWDGDKSVAQRYQISGMPTLFIIDQQGLVRFVHSGFRPGDEEQISAAIDSLL
jgi:cytochrome c biogenesis protein CcmG/thiol:disulfide interchange protein DsbE